MHPIRISPFAVVLLAASSLAPRPAAAVDPPKGTPEQRQTISQIRNVGTAMFSWLSDQVAEKEKTQPAPAAKPKDPAKPEPEGIDLTAIPRISVEELTKVLVPKYIVAIPVNDGWGHPMEYYLETKDLYSEHIMGLRSSGADGVFADKVYAIGAFAPDDPTADIVWTDGYFARWPEKPKTSR
jgi:hypothetical protein